MSEVLFYNQIILHKTCYFVFESLNLKLLTAESAVTGCLSQGTRASC